VAERARAAALASPVVGTDPAGGRLTRRRLLTLALAGGATALLAACAQETAPGGSAAVPVLVEGTPTRPEPPPTISPATATPAPTATPVPPTATPRPPSPLLVNPQFRRQGTPVTDALGPDGYTWAQGNPLIVDRHDKIITVAQRSGGQGHVFVFSNDGGATWHDDAAQIAGMVRASLAYDDSNDLLHALWRGQGEGDGIVYRRYTIGRDPRANVTAIIADPAGEVRLDGRPGDATMIYEHPIIHWLSGAELGNRHGAVLCVWSARHTRPELAGNEVRAAMRLLDNTSQDAVAANWIAPGSVAAASIGHVPAVAYTKLVSNLAPGVIYPSLGRKRGGAHRGDLYLCYADGGTGEGGGHRWRWRRFPWDATARRWGEGTPEALIAPIARGGSDRGYEYKYQLGSKVVEDPAGDRVYFGFASWKDDAAGDTWSFAQINADDSVAPVVDVYSCGGRFQPELYALTGDLAFDEKHRRLIVAYIHTGLGENHGYLRVYDGATPAEPERRFFSAADVDIPLLWQDARTGRCRYGDSPAQRLLILFRDTNGQAPPYRGWFGTLDWAG
jgi:hypothetical protein